MLKVPLPLVIIPLLGIHSLKGQLIDPRQTGKENRSLGFVGTTVIIEKGLEGVNLPNLKKIRKDLLAYTLPCILFFYWFVYFLQTNQIYVEITNYHKTLIKFRLEFALWY